jgi:hypothetical protein
MVISTVIYSFRIHNCRHCPIFKNKRQIKKDKVVGGRYSRSYTREKLHRVFVCVCMGGGGANRKVPSEWEAFIRPPFLRAILTRVIHNSSLSKQTGWAMPPRQ